jgi:phosphoribosyl 1,2-cyclic phosphodiesterase
MSLFVTSLNSGSNGNCYYLGNDTEAILIDAGISCRETEKRMANLSLSMDKVKAIFISHEHTDHTRGAEVLSRKYRLPVYITAATLRNSSTVLAHTLIRHFDTSEKITIGCITVVPFTKRHDAIDPVSFMVECNGVRVSVITDIGFPCDEVKQYFSQSHASFLEANYDEQMLENGSYPFHLKKRIRGGMGHLSNRQSHELFSNHRSEYLSHIFLSHLSKENNCPEVVHNLFSENCGSITVVVASRYKETPVYTITGTTPAEKRSQLLSEVGQKVIRTDMKQLSIFD